MKDKVETRVRKGFLLFPMEIDDKIKWLCFASWVEEFHGDGGGGAGASWVPIRWI